MFVFLGHKQQKNIQREFGFLTFLIMCNLSGKKLDYLEHERFTKVTFNGNLVS